MGMSSDYIWEEDRISFVSFWSFYFYFAPLNDRLRRMLFVFRTYSPGTIDKAL